MPIYAVDLKKPVNFSKLDSFKSSSKEAKEIWKLALEEDQRGQASDSNLSQL